MNPIIVDANNTVIAGHGRLLAAKELKLQRVPVIRAEHLSEAQVRGYRIADNRLAERAEWNRELLKVELAALATIDIDFEVELTGFETPEIDVLLDEFPDEADDAFPMADLPAAEQVVSRLGDLWRLGPHRLLCADARDGRALDRLMAGDGARMAFLDPPYNLPIAGHVSGLGMHQHREFPMASGELSCDGFAQFLREALGNLARVSLDGAIHAVCMDWRHLPELLDAGDSVYTQQLNLCVWRKSNGGMGSLYRSQHELVAIFKVGRAAHVNIRNRFGDRVADVVNACSDSVANTSAGESKADWRTRKTRYLQHLAMVDKDVLLVSLADKIHNARSILRDLRRPDIGSQVWDRFSKPKQDTLWYYEELARAFQARLAGQLADELKEIVDVLKQ